MQRQRRSLRDASYAARLANAKDLDYRNAIRKLMTPTPDETE